MNARAGAVLLPTLCLLLAFCAPPPSTSNANPPWGQGLAVQLWSFHADLDRDLPGTLRRVRQLGFERVETYPVSGVSGPQLRAALDRAGLRAVSVHVPYEWLRDDLPRAIAYVRELGGEQFGPGSIDAFDANTIRPMTAAEADAAGAVLARACKAARDSDQRLFVHTHGNEVAGQSGRTPLDRMIERADGCFDIEADLFWIRWAGVDPVAFLRAHDDRVTTLHLKDMAPGAAGKPLAQMPEASVPIGTGSIDMRAVLRVARTAGVRHYIVEDESAHSFEQIARSVAWLNRDAATIRR